MRKTTKIDVNPSTELMMSHEIAFAKMDMNPTQMDVISLLLAEIGKDDDDDIQRNYTLTADQFFQIKQYQNKHKVYEVMKERVTGKDRLTKIDMTIYRNDDDVETYNWFSSVRYFNGSLILHVQPEVKEMLVALKHSGGYKVFGALQYILPMKSYYSKRIYMMCRNYVSSGNIYKIDWEKFKEMLQIPSSYSAQKIKVRVLEVAKDEIEKYTDLTIDYDLKTSRVRGGKKIDAISFTIRKKKALTDKQKAAIEAKEANAKPEQGKQSTAAVDRKNGFGDFNQRTYDYDELEQILQDK